VKFAELGSARQVSLWWREQHLKFPVRRPGLRSHPVVWVDPLYRMIRATLHHPVYAGAYVFGRSETRRELDGGETPRLRIPRVQRKDWPVLIRDHHPGYISFEQFLENQHRMQENTAMTRGAASQNGAAREGRALLQGLARCGICGRRLYVSYGGHRSQRGRGRTMQYRCARARLSGGGPDCQTIGGRRVDEAVVAVFLEVTEPAGVEAAQVADEELQRGHAALAGYWQLSVEKAEYEAQRAERQFHAAEPENRLVARELERRWNAKLVELEAVRGQAQAARCERPGLTEDEKVRAHTLGGDLGAVWTATTTTNRDRKRLLRCVIDEVQLTTEASRYLVRIVWKGGALTDRDVKRLPRGGTANATEATTIDLIRTLAREFDDAQMARILNKQGRRSGRGNTFTKAMVTSLRGHYGIATREKTRARDPREGPFTADEAAAELGVAMPTIHRWLREGILAGEQATPGAPWRIVLTEAVRRRLSGGEAPLGWVGLTEAASRLGLSKSHVAYLVKTGKLPAVHATVGKRRCWRIDVSSATCGRQSGLFDQMHNATPEEA
jgi:Recombinase zinc beta ribbon domain/Recombinase/Helix-turn-helix domain